MYKMLLCLRYLRTRYIALASIISVTLGVATMIVVNSVMAGFRVEMHNRLQGFLSDIVVEAHSLEGIGNPAVLENEIREVLGDDLEGLTSTVHVPAMISFQARGQWITKQVNLIGIDEQTYADVGDFSQYLLHPENQHKLSFLLKDKGYDARLTDAGWSYRRARAAYDRAYQQQLEQIEREKEYFRGLQDSGLDVKQQTASGDATIDVGPRQAQEIATNSEVPYDPFAAAPTEEAAIDVFDASREQHTGIVLGIAISNIRYRNPDGEVKDVFLCKPGDDVRVTFPKAGTPPEAESDLFTIVDLYESKMSEYDSGFAFVPLKKLQDLRGMFHPVSGVAAVSSIQLKLREGADLNAARYKLRERFPTDIYPYQVQTWKEMQGPLLAAVQLESTILNILLFLIICVAGFGILATFFMIVVEKTKDIGIMKSLGAPRGGVMSIFLTYGLSLGMVGAGVGMVLGLLFVININRIAAVLESITGREVFDPTIYYFQRIPTIISPVTIAWIVVGAMSIAVLASILPALRAARMHPVEALRYE